MKLVPSSRFRKSLRRLHPRIQRHVWEKLGLFLENKYLPCTSAPWRLRSLPSAAEVDANDVWQRAVIGLACVCNSGQQVHSVLMHAIRAMENWRMDAEVVDYDIPRGRSARSPRAPVVTHKHRRRR